MTRSGRRRVLREDVLAPVLVMAVIVGLWWIGARVVAELGSPRDSLETPSAASTPAMSAPPGRSDRERVARPDSATARGATPPPESSAEAGLSSVSELSEPDTADAEGGEVSPEDVDLLRARRLRVPVDGIDAETLMSNYHQKRGAGSHEAMDIMAPRGTLVRAVEGGRIVKLFTSKLGGITIYQFDPSESFCYYYAHLDAYASSLTEGAKVTSGDVIGFVGSTGNASPDAPHLHFAIFKLGPERRWWQGRPIDPYLVLR